MCTNSISVQDRLVYCVTNKASKGAQDSSVLMAAAQKGVNPMCETVFVSSCAINVIPADLVMRIILLIGV